VRRYGNIIIIIIIHYLLLFAYLRVPKYINAHTISPTDTATIPISVDQPYAGPAASCCNINGTHSIWPNYISGMQTFASRPCRGLEESTGSDPLGTSRYQQPGEGFLDP
jgi:hypothetical protein